MQPGSTHVAAELSGLSFKTGSPDFSMVDFLQGSRWTLLTIFITVFVTRGRHFEARDQSQFDHIFSRQSREKIFVKLTQGPQNDSRGHKNSAE
jgi:hypothetical protein